MTSNPDDAFRLRWHYDPELHGADCTHCSLYGRMVVPSQLRPGSPLTIVAEAPGHTEETFGYPLCGPSGDETERALLEAGLRRSDVSFCNAMCCRAPESSYDAHLRMVRRRNKERKKRGLDPLRFPHEACLPRLLNEIENARSIVLIGKIARQAIALAIKRASEPDEIVVGKTVPTDDGSEHPTITDEFGHETEAKDVPEGQQIPARGFPGVITIRGHNIPCLSSVHPAFVLRSRRWTKVFRADVRKAARMSRGALRWIEPSMLFFPTPEQLGNFLFGLRRDELVAYDTETDSLEPTEARLRCIGIGTKVRVVCVPFNSVETVPSWGGYTRDEKERIREIVLSWFADRNGSVIAQNEKYDRTVLERCGELPGFVMNRRVFDTAIAHHVAWSEWPHDLDFMIAQYLDAPHHKGVRHDRWKSDRDLHHYCMLDVARTAEVAECLLREPALAEQHPAFDNDMFLSFFCRRLGEIGIKIDVAERDRLHGVQTAVMNQKEMDARALARQALERSGRASRSSLQLADTLNPNSTQQVGRMIYEAIGIEPVPEKAGGLTDTGEPSTAEDVLYYLMDRGLPDTVERMLLAIIDYRSASKLRGTYCTVQPRWDGRVRPTWNPHVVVSGRLSCSKPNVMNLERSIRSMYVAEPGHLLVACDKAQLEARITAWLAQDVQWIDAFLAGKDIHKVNACALLGIPTVDQVSKAHRQFTKTFVYAIQYLAGLKKAYQMIRNFVDPATSERPYRTRSFSEISLCYRRFWNAHQAIERYHEGNRAKWKREGFIADAIQGRRRYFLDGEAVEDVREEMANMPIQSCLPGDVRVLTRAGYCPIGGVSERGEVWTGTRWAPYTKISRPPNDIGELVLANGQILRCDTNHQVLVVGNDDYEFRHWDDLAPGDRVCLSMPTQVEFGDVSLVDDETAYWMGFAIGNGSTAYGLGHRNCLTMTFGNRKLRYLKEERANRFALWAECSGFSVQAPGVYSGSVSLAVESKRLRSWWESLGYPWGATAHNKRIPSVIWSASLSGRKQFLLGLLDADGCACPSRVGIGKSQPNLHLCQRELLAQVQVLARASGIESRLHGPYQGGISWRLNINLVQLSTVLGYGSAKIRAKSMDIAPRFVVREFLARVGNRTATHHTSVATLLHRMRTGGSVSVFMLPVMARCLGVEVPVAYSTVALVEKRLTGERLPVFTLFVDDPGHRFDSEGVISKNTASADVNLATKRVVETFPWGFDGANTGLVHQAHDSLMMEVSEARAAEVGARMVDLMFSKLGDMPLPVDLAIGRDYGHMVAREKKTGVWAPK